METSNIYIDIITAVAAVIAAITAIYTAIITYKSNQKKDLLQNYTAERLRDLHEMKENANVLLEEAAIIVYYKVDEEDINISDKINRIIEASNRYWFVLKPVYKRDEEVLYAMVNLRNALIGYYKGMKKGKQEKYVVEIKKKGECFKKLAFTYAHSSWTCIKNQIMKGEFSQYKEFDFIYENNKKVIDILINNNDVWSI